jgi:hypothetical protein
MQTDCPACRGRNDGPPREPLIYTRRVRKKKNGEWVTRVVEVRPPRRQLDRTLKIRIENVEGRPLDEDQWTGVCVCGHGGALPGVLQDPVVVEVEL